MPKPEQKKRRRNHAGPVLSGFGAPCCLVTQTSENPLKTDYEPKKQAYN